MWSLSRTQIATLAVVAASAMMPSATEVAPTCAIPVDIVLVIDSSGSIDGSERTTMQNFAKALIDTFTVGQDPDMTRVAVVEFGKFVGGKMQLNQPTSNADVDVVLSQPRDTSLLQQTNTPAALQYVRDVVFTPASGARTLPEVARFVVVITDGQSTIDGGATNLTPQTAAAAQALRDDGAVVLALGVGDFVDENELLEIAGDPTRKFFSEEFNGLQYMLEEVAFVTCPTCRTAVDLAFVLDNSGSITSDSRDRMLMWARDIASEYTVSPGTYATRIAVLEYASHVRDLLNFSGSVSNAVVEEALSQDRTNSIRKQTNTPAALTYAKDVYFNTANGARDPLVTPVQRTAIVVTDGQSTIDGGNTWLTPQTAAAAQALRDHGVLVIAVGIGQSVNQDELLAIAGDSDRAFWVRRPQWIYNTLQRVLDAACPSGASPEASTGTSPWSSAATTSGVAVGVAAGVAIVGVVALMALRPKYALRPVSGASSLGEGDSTDQNDLGWDDSAIGAQAASDDDAGAPAQQVLSDASSISGRSEI